MKVSALSISMFVSVSPHEYLLAKYGRVPVCPSYQEWSYSAIWFVQKYHSVSISYPWMPTFRPARLQLWRHLVVWFKADVKHMMKARIHPRIVPHRIKPAFPFRENVLFPSMSTRIKANRIYVASLKHCYSSIRNIMLDVSVGEQGDPNSVPAYSHTCT